MSVIRFDAVDASDPGACAAFLDLALSLPDVQRWKKFSHYLLQVGRGDSVLDIGCGTGNDAIAIARLVGAAGQVVGVDISHALIAIATTRATPDLPLTFRQADIHDLPFADDTFDATRVDRVLHFLSDPSGALREAIRVTAPGGRLVVTEPDWGQLSIAGGDPALTSLVVKAAAGLGRARRIGRDMSNLLADVGMTLVTCHETALELRDYDRAVTLFGLEALAAHAMGAEDTRIWLASLRAAASEGAFNCRLGGTIAHGAKPYRA